VTGRTGKTMREERRTYKRRRCSYTEPTGFRCRAAPAAGSSRCLLHTEPDRPDALDRPATGCEHGTPACLPCWRKTHR